MARKHKSNSRSHADPHVEEELLTRHICELGFSTIQDYQDWCGHQGLSRKLNKSARQRQQEIALMSDNIRKAHRKFRQLQRRLHRNPLSVLTAICDGQLNADDVPVPLLKRFCGLLNQAGKQGESAVNRQALKHCPARPNRGDRH